MSFLPAKDETIKSLSEPHFSLGKIISKYCPNFGLDFDKHAHIIAVYPVSTDGIFALEKLAQTYRCVHCNQRRPDEE